LKFADKIKLINLYSPLAIIGNICQLLGTSIYYILEKGELDLGEVLIGVGCFCAWATLPRYLM
jgi:hypothetical protein